MSAKLDISRRPLLAGIMAVLGLGAAGGLLYEVPRLFGRRYPRTPYDDLLDQLGDRESAARLGRAALAEIPANSGIAVLLDPEKAAEALRQGPAQGSIARAVELDIVQGRVAEVHGWILPLSLLSVAAIAAKAPPE